MGTHKFHGKNRDQFLDRNGLNESSAPDVKDAIDKKHAQGTDTALGVMSADIDMNNKDIININILKLDDAEIEHNNVTHNPIYLSGQSGLNDLSSSGTYTLTGNAIFQIKIKSIGTPDNFEWRKGTSGSWSAPVAMTGSAQLLQDGISITWGTTTGHTNNDEWEMNVGHEVHISEALHVTDDATISGNLTVAGEISSLSPVKFRPGIDGGIATDIIRERTIDAGVLIDGLLIKDGLIPAKIIDESTGLIQGGAISVNGGDSTLIDISAGSGQIVDSTTDPDNPVLTPVSWDAKIGYNLTTIAPSSDLVAIYLSLDSGGNVIERLALPTPEQRRNTIDLGIAARNDADIIVFAGSGPTNVIHNPGSQLQDLLEAWGAFNINGNKIQPYASGLQFQKASGTVFRNGVNFQTNGKNPHRTVLSELVPVSPFNYKLGDGTDVAFASYIDPNSYDDGTSTLATVPNNKWTVQYISVFASNVVEVLYGQEIFSTEEEAITAIANLDLIIPSDSMEAIPLAYLVVQQGDTSLPADRFYRIFQRGGGGGSVSYWNRTGTELSPSNVGDSVILATQTELSSTPNFSSNPNWIIFSGLNTWTYDSVNDRMIPTGELTGDTIADTGIALTSGKTYVISLSWLKSAGSLQIYQGSGGTLISDYTDNGAFSRKWVFAATANENLFVRTTSAFHDDTTTDYISELSVVEIDNLGDSISGRLALGGLKPEYYSQLGSYADTALFFPQSKGILTVNDFEIRNINSGGIDFDETYARPILSSYNTSLAFGSNGYASSSLRADDNINLRTYTPGGAITLNESSLDTDFVLNGDGVEAYKYDAGNAIHTFTGDVEMPNLINDQASSKYFDIGTMRIQWGTITYSNDAPTAMTLPASFANTTYTVLLSLDDWTYNAGKGPGDVSNGISVTAKATTTFTVNRDNDLAGTTKFDWIAIGLKP